ncbi:hypothetical protein [Plantactinospora endophytica]|uniref:Uncharacterized protein n=1 Tax=Plantactinospora endophytica TaxID=673535 RepID=A0ABQ4E1J7_9ACTN|nr:hypothetical protein [Plantactinospora endophytica]GIG88217.1 hypothetical protein Pen02_31530 [Plantactinospora endophytica]
MRGHETASEIGIVAVANDNTFAHAYRDVSTLLSDDIMGIDSLHRDDLAFFDATGHRLLPVFGPERELVDLRRSTEAPDPEGLRRRLAEVVRHVESYLRAHPELAERSGLTPEAAVAGLPDPERQSLAELLAAFPHEVRPEVEAAWWQPRTMAYADRGSYFHNALHAAGWTH